MRVRIFHRLPVEPSDVVVVVDVIRAFTTAAAAFAQGAEGVVCVTSEGNALALRRTMRDAVLAGERDGLRPPEFDVGNSPNEALESALSRRSVILLTQNGTPALVGARDATHLLATAAVNVSATANWILQHRSAGLVSIYCTGTRGEDQACAEHLQALLEHRRCDASTTRARIVASTHLHLDEWRQFHDPNPCELFRRDAEFCAAVDAYDFAMVGQYDSGTVRLRRRA